jgi:ketosteroid isomerase-like protein
MSGSFEDVYAIQKLKYRYGTALDTKDFVAMTDLMVDDVTVAYGGGAVTLQGRENVRDWMTNAMGSRSMLSNHFFSHPIIDVDGDTATGAWELMDIVILEDPGLLIRGASIYADTYVRVDGEWKIKHTGYKRLWEEIGPRGDFKTTAAWFGTDGRSSLV